MTEGAEWTNETFNKKFDELIKDEGKYPHYVHAYKELEDEHVRLFGKIRYASYDSFRRCRRYLLFKR